MNFRFQLENVYSVTTPTKATRQKVPQIYQIKIAEFNNGFSTNKLCNLAAHLKGNSFVVILDLLKKLL